MTTFPFDAFIRLVEFDQQTKQLGIRIDKEEKAIAQLHMQKVMLDQDLEHLKLSVHTMQKAVDAKELDMKVLDERARSLKHKIDNIVSTKEYSSFRKELDVVHAQQNALEDDLVNAWHQLEVAQRTLQQKSEAIGQTIEKNTVELTDKEAQLRELRNDLDVRRKTRSERLHTIPEEWLEKYEGMYTRVDDPVVPVVDGSCSGCFYSVLHQDLARLKRRALLQCNSCYRFLYDPSMLQSNDVE
jgi:predicted  nucleic acid-binding Zn-ribbon protein